MLCWFFWPLSLGDSAVGGQLSQSVVPEVGTSILELVGRQRSCLGRSPRHVGQRAKACPNRCKKSILYCYTILHYTILYSTILYYTVLYYTYYIILYDTIYCIILYFMQVTAQNGELCLAFVLHLPHIEPNAAQRCRIQQALPSCYIVTILSRAGDRVR